MTKEFLHNTPQFAELFADSRFLSAVMYLRQHIKPRSETVVATDQILLRAGKVEGWLACLDELESLQHAPAPQGPPTTQRPAYTSETTK